MKQVHAWAAALLCLSSFPAMARIEPAPDMGEDGQIYVSKFNLDVEAIEGHGVKVTLESDIPEPVMLAITATRTYKGKLATDKRPEEFAIPYLQTTISAGSLKRGQVFHLDDHEWNRQFVGKYEESKAAGMMIWPSSISKRVEFTVSVKRDRLTGPIVNAQYGMNFVETSKHLNLPLLSDAESAAMQQGQSQTIYYGMSKDRVLASAWGKPQRKEMAVDAKGVTVERWIYPGDNILMFTGDVLTSSKSH